MFGLGDKGPRMGGRRGSYSSRNYHERMSGHVWAVSFSSMNGWQRRTMKLQQGDQVRFSYEAHAETGSITTQLLAPDGSAALTWGPGSPPVTDFTATLTGKYSLRVTLDHAAGGFRIELPTTGVGEPGTATIG